MLLSSLVRDEQRARIEAECVQAAEFVMQMPQTLQYRVEQFRSQPVAVVKELIKGVLYPDLVQPAAVVLVMAHEYTLVGLVYLANTGDEMKASSLGETWPAKIF